MIPTGEEKEYMLSNTFHIIKTPVLVSEKYVW